MGYVRHTYDSPSPNEEHEISLDEEDLPDFSAKVQKQKDDIEALSVFLQL